MAKPKDQEALACYCKVLLTLGHVAGYIRWTPLAAAWVARELSSQTIKTVRIEMQKHVANGGQVDQVEERRPEYVSWRFRYDLRLPISGRRVYIETVLEQATAIEDCTIWVVNIHDQ